MSPDVYDQVILAFRDKHQAIATIYWPLVTAAMPQ
jgi:hypothetical protein